MASLSSEESTEASSREAIDSPIEGRAEDTGGDEDKKFVNNENDSDDWETITERRDDITIQRGEDSNEYPHFHVTYWMFYPYSQVMR